MSVTSTCLILRNMEELDLFDHGMRCRSDLPNIKQAVSDEFIDQLSEPLEIWQRWSVDRIARKLSEAAYLEFEKRAKEKHSRPDFDYFLQGAIEHEYSYFLDDLRMRIGQILEKNCSVNKAVFCQKALTL